VDILRFDFGETRPDGAHRIARYAPRNVACELPLNEILVDFNDKIKSITRGYGSMDYEHAGYRPAEIGQTGFARERRARRCVFDNSCTRIARTGVDGQLAAKLKEVIPRQLYQVAIQAAIGGKIIARRVFRRYEKT